MTFCLELFVRSGWGQGWFIAEMCIENYLIDFSETVDDTNFVESSRVLFRKS